MSGTTRVCVFTSAHDTTDTRVVQREAVSLDEASYDVTYYTPYEGDSPVEVVSYADAASGDYPQIKDRMRYAVTVARLLYDTDYDVYHFHGVEVLPVGVLIKLVSNGTAIYDVPEDVEAVLRHKPIFPQLVRPYFAKAVCLLERVLARFVDGIIVASPDIGERFGGFDEVAVVTNYPKRRWAEETDIEERHTSDDGGPVRFVYRGLLSENRGVLTLMEAIDKVPEEHSVSLVLGGRFASQGIRERVQHRVATSERIEFVEWFPTIEGMYHHYRESDIGMMCFHPDPNKTNAVHRSNKLFQYMAAGLPIIVSDIGNWTRLVEDIECGIAVDPTDPDAIADAMAELAADPDRRARLGRNGHQATLDRYNWEAQREELLALYERLTA